MTTTPPLSADEKRARWCREVGVIARAVAEHALPFPQIFDSRAIFGIYGDEADVRRRFGHAEAVLGEALGVAFTERPETLGTGSLEWYVLEAELPSGMILRVTALAKMVAERHVTSGKVTEWVRKPATVPAGSGAAA